LKSPNNAFLKGIVKDYKTYSDRLNHCRLDLDAEKSKLAKCSDPYKRDKYNGNSNIYIYIYIYFFFRCCCCY